MNPIVALGIIEAYNHKHPTWSHVIAGGPCTKFSLPAKLWAWQKRANRLFHIF